MGNTAHRTDIRQDKLLQLINALGVARKLASHIHAFGYKGLTPEEMEMVCEIEGDLDDMNDCLWPVYEGIHCDPARSQGNS